LEPLAYQVGRWLEGPTEQIAGLSSSHSVLQTTDAQGRRVALFSSPFYLDLYEERYPAITFKAIP
jgi:peptide subunit release factor RF-3